MKFFKKMQPTNTFILPSHCQLELVHSSDPSSTFSHYQLRYKILFRGTYTKNVFDAATIPIHAWTWKDYPLRMLFRNSTKHTTRIDHERIYSRIHAILMFDHVRTSLSQKVLSNSHHSK